MNTRKPWPLYVHKKFLHAVKIDTVVENNEENEVGIKMTTISFVKKEYEPIEVFPSFIAHHRPKPGDYIIQNPTTICCMDGLDFEEAMTLVNDNEDTHL